jgi:hypothetical protein
MSLARAVLGDQISRQNEEETRLDFELHYGLSCNSAREVLREILEDMSSHKHIQNWGEKLVNTPIKTLAGVVRECLYGTFSGLDTSMESDWLERLTSSFNGRRDCFYQWGEPEANYFARDTGRREPSLFH